MQDDILDAIKQAIRGHKGRTLPIYTQQWANIRDFYDPPAVKAQLKKDMDAAVIPFFEYHDDTGHVTYNGAKIFHGLTLDQAFAELATKFV